MSTERRKSPRLRVALDVVLNHHAQSVICGMRDISLGGAFLDADPELLPYAGAIELCFSIPSGAKLNFVRLPATIQRVTENGAAVTFGDLGGEVYFQLVDLTATPPPGARPSRLPH